MGWATLGKLIGRITFALCLVTPASAAWMRAETAHFIVYSDDKESEVRKMAAELETFDAVLRRFHTTSEQDGAGSNKLTVYVVADVGAVQRLCGKCANVYGYYMGRASGSVAFTPRNTGAGSAMELNARTVLYHEYAHHFLFGNYASAYPVWFSEGYAEFASTFRRHKDGLMIGAVAQHRAHGLFSGAQLPAAAMFDPAGRKLSPDQLELVYGRGWLLTHYIMFNDARRTQFAQYLTDLNSGVPSPTAATKAFGKLSDLDKDLSDYMTGKKIKAMVLPFSMFPQPAVTLRALSPGEAAMMEYRLASTTGVNTKTAKPLFARAQPVAARYPDSAEAQGWFAEIAFDAGELDSADAAADRAIALDPRSAQGLVYKGMIGISRALKDKSDAAAWKSARAYIIRANKIDPDNALPLLAFYQSYAAEGIAPTKNAVTGLLRAQELAPQDPGLRFTAVVQSIRDGELERARTLLQPLAYNPHGGANDDTAKLLTALETVKDKAGAVAALDAILKTDEATTAK